MPQSNKKTNKKSNNKATLGFIAAVIIFVFAAGAFYFNSQNNEEQKPASTSPYAENLERVHSPSLGPQNAPVTIVEFLDPECETCRQFYPHVKAIMKEYPNDVRLVVRYLPFHKNSKFIVKILEAARKQGKFWEALSILFERQPQWGNHHNPQPELVWTFLPQVGLNIKTLKEDMNDPATDEIIRIDLQDASIVQAKYTPTFFVNGKPLPSFGLQQLATLVREEVEKSK